MASANSEIRAALDLAGRRTVDREERALAQLEAQLEELHMKGLTRIPSTFRFPPDLPPEHGIGRGQTIRRAIARIFDDLMEQPLAGWDARQ